MNKYMEDCIHLKACRRLCVIAKESYDINPFSRGCNENCNAYESISDYYTSEQVEAVKRGACLDGQRGYDPYDLLVSDYI